MFSGTTMQPSLLVLLVLCVVVNGEEKDGAPVIQTSTGRLSGLVRESENATRVYVYEGVRFGTADRFKWPHMVEPKHYNESYDATHVRYACPQPGFPLANGSDTHNLTEARFSSEDCLFLNIWTPATAIDEHRKLAVMLWIHGGSFKVGNIFMDLYDGRHLAALGDVVVVSINYRLGVLGWIADKEDWHQESGNDALYDMLLALTWVRINIGHFGGDPDQVTLFGESAGSIAVGALAVKTAMPKYFKRVIMQSGVPNVIPPHAVVAQASDALARAVGCPGVEEEGMVACLRGKDAYSLVDHDYVFQPLYGDALLPSSPLQLIKHHQLDIDILIGFTQDEGAYFVNKLLKLVNVSNAQEAKVMMQAYFAQIRNANYTDVVEHYLHNASSTTADVHKAMEAMISDGYFKCPTFDFVRALSGSNKSHHHYVYELKQAVDVDEYECHKTMGVCHTADLVFTFGRPISHPDRFTDADYRLSREIIRLWSTFAKTGSVDKVGGSVDWLEANHASGDVVNVMQLAHGQYKLDAHDTAPACQVWQGLLYPV